jgi:Primase X
MGREEVKLTLQQQQEQKQQQHVEVNNNSSSSNQKIELGLDFILSHFIVEGQFFFPRKISTYKSNNKQFLVRSKQEVIDAFIESKFVDCRINAYPSLTDYKGIQRHKPDLIFIDLDKNNFKSDRSFQLALSKTLKNINEQLDSDAYPTVLDTGGGYHIYQPVYIPTALEYITEFSKFDRPSEQFLRFAKDYLSNGKADKNNNPSFKSCLLRIPESINSKYGTKVKIVQNWNGYRPPIPREFIEEFRTFLIQKKIDDEANRQKEKIMLLKKLKRQYKNKCSTTINVNYYDWIETKILANPFSDCRKIIVDLILGPYLINIKKISYDEAYRIVREWLDKCNNLKKLDNYQNFVNYRIHSALKTAASKGIGPMSLYKIKTDSRYSNNLYLLILQNEKEVTSLNEKG